MSQLDNDELSPSQEKTLRTLQKFIDENGYPPTVEELASRLRLTKASVHGSLEQNAFNRGPYGFFISQGIGSKRITTFTPVQQKRKGFNIAMTAQIDMHHMAFFKIDIGLLALGLAQSQTSSGLIHSHILHSVN